MHCSAQELLVPAAAAAAMPVPPIAAALALLFVYVKLAGHQPGPQSSQFHGRKGRLEAHLQLRRDAIALQDGLLADAAAACQYHQLLCMLLQILHGREHAMASQLVDLQQRNSCLQLEVVAVSRTPQHQERLLDRVELHPQRPVMPVRTLDLGQC